MENGMPIAIGHAQRSDGQTVGAGEAVANSVEQPGLQIPTRTYKQTMRPSPVSDSAAVINAMSNIEHPAEGQLFVPKEGIRLLERHPYLLAFFGTIMALVPAVVVHEGPEGLAAREHIVFDGPATYLPPLLRYLLMLLVYWTLLESTVPILAISNDTVYAAAGRRSAAFGPERCTPVKVEKHGEPSWLFTCMQPERPEKPVTLFSTAGVTQLAGQGAGRSHVNDPSEPQSSELPDGGSPSERAAQRTGGSTTGGGEEPWTGNWFDHPLVHIRSAEDSRTHCSAMRYEIAPTDGGSDRNGYASTIFVTPISVTNDPLSASMPFDWTIRTTPPATCSIVHQEHHLTVHGNRYTSFGPRRNLPSLTKIGLPASSGGASTYSSKTVWGSLVEFASKALVKVGATFSKEKGRQSAVGNQLQIQEREGGALNKLSYETVRSDVFVPSTLRGVGTECGGRATIFERSPRAHPSQGFLGSITNALAGTSNEERIPSFIELDATNVTWFHNMPGRGSVEYCSVMYHKFHVANLVGKAVLVDGSITRETQSAAPSGAIQKQDIGTVTSTLKLDAVVRTSSSWWPFGGKQRAADAKGEKYLKFRLNLLDHVTPLVGLGQTLPQPHDWHFDDVRFPP